MTDRLRILVGVYFVRGPMGGLTWHYLQYALALAALGHDVHVVEDSGDHEWCCYDPTREAVDGDPGYGLAYADEVARRVGLAERWVYHDALTGRSHGPAAARFERIVDEADLFVNVSGVHVARPWMQRIPRRAFVDTDPVFTQVRGLTLQDDRALLDAHTSFHTYGERFGTGECTMPDDGRPWRPTRQPMDLASWPVTPGRTGAPYTTVMRWDSYKPQTFDGRTFGMKSQSFAPFLGLPQATGLPLEIAFGGPGPADELRAHGWQLRHPFEVTRTPWAFQDYLASSRAEFTIAKHGYVSTGSGWFSERTAAYLASGRPAVAQDTGFSRLLPTGEGLLAFSDPDEAARALEDVERRYDHHCRAARALAEEYFDGRRVMEALLADALV